jgi:hypothetical protein
MGPIFKGQEIQERLLDPLRSKDFLRLKMEGLLTLGDGSNRFPEMSVQNYHSTLRNIAPLAKYLSIMANLIEAGIASRYFVDYGANFLEQNLKVTFGHPDEIPES